MTKIIIGMTLVIAIQAEFVLCSHKFYVTVDEDEISIEFNNHILELREHTVRKNPI